MRKLLKGVLLIGAVAGGIAAVRSYLKREPQGEEVVQLVFDDGATITLPSNTAQGMEFTDIARKVVELGV